MERFPLIALLAATSVLASASPATPREVVPVKEFVPVTKGGDVKPLWLDNRDCYGYIGFGPSWFGPIVPCVVTLRDVSNGSRRTTTSYWHPFGLFGARYYFNGVAANHTYDVTVTPAWLYRSAGFRVTVTKGLGDFKFPDVRVQ